MKLFFSRRGPLLCLVLLALWSAGCSASPQAGSAEPKTVTFRTSGDPAEQTAYESLVNAFNESHPDVHIEMTHIASDSDYRTRLATDFAAGTAPDVSLMNYRRIAAFAASDKLELVGPYLDKSEVIQPSDFYPIAIDAFMWQGTLSCLPQNISSLVVYYNKNLFDAAGLSYPANDWTWVDFVTTAKALTIDENGDGEAEQYGLGVQAGLYRLVPFIWQNSAPLVDNPDAPKRLVLTRPPSLEALQWFVDLRQQHGVVPGREEEASLDSESRFIQGQTAMFLDSRRGTPTYREIEAFDWDVAPLPRGKEQAGILHSDGYCMSSTTANKDAAWSFIEYANSVEGQTIIAETGRTVPSLIEVAESDAFLNPDALPKNSRVWIDTASILQHVPVISTWDEIEKTASSEIDRAFYGDISAEEAATLAVQRTEEYFQQGVTATP